MGLETPLALLGLAAALLPWLAHRIRRRDLTPVPLPTLQLLRRAEANKRRSRGLTDLLLLLLRIGILIAASIALAAPYVSARLHFGDGTVASAAIVIDDSLSMLRREGAENLLALALDQARRAIDSLPEHSEVSLIAAGRPARVLARRSSDLALVRAALARVPPTSVRGTDLPGALRLAAQQLESARHPTRRVLVLSEFASHTGLKPEDVRVAGLQVTLERIGSLPPPANLYFTSVRALPDPSAKGQSSIAVELAAYGEAPERVPVRIDSSGRTLARSELQVVAGAAHGVFQVPTPTQDSDPTALLTIEAEDALDVDNSAGVLLRPSDAISVMLVNGDPRPSSDQDELHYARSALRLADAVGSSFAIRVVDGSALAKHDLTQVDVLVLANAEPVSDATAARITRFVRKGGGLIVTAGDRVDPKRYNATLGAALPCQLRARAKGDTELAAPQASALFPAGQSGLTQTKTRERLMLDCRAEVALRFGDGAPALAIGNVERGRSALLATTLDADWTDLPLRPGYLPLLTRLIRDVAQAQLAISGAVAAGERVQLAVPPDAQSLEVVTPEGIRHPFEDVAGKVSVEFTATQSAGPYRVLATSERGVSLDAPRAAFVVETPRAESDLTPLPQVETWGASATQSGSGATVRHSLAAQVLLLFALLVFAEGALRTRGSR
jgi:hypothetical protein